MLKLSILDQSRVRRGMTARQALEETVRLAREADKLGFTRFWVSEHHDTPGLAGSAPEVLIAAIAAQTTSIRVGSGGVLISHYSPYKIAETFRVLEGLYPGRIDLGIGRAPGGMPLASMALRYGKPANSEDRYLESLHDLGGFLGGGFPQDHPYHGLLTTPLIDTSPDVWLLGSTGHSAQRAAELGARFSFAHFINGDGGQEVVRSYREHYRPGSLGTEAQAGVCIMVVCAETDELAEQMALPLDVGLLLLEKLGSRTPFPTAEEAAAYKPDDFDRQRMAENRKRMIVGGPARVKQRLLEFAADYEVDELMVTLALDSYEAKLQACKLLARELGLQEAGR
ncbi:LLM class flavin-dependent oxidoreductase [Paenibacillus tarimensis]|uniref:LLM class flavin-dependent oxidoreductase n=1 Tax=Paenibacillus tarimensis TaxID=416012 RepID=UPI001F448CC8|nr:LLM class flavin-dependent oxidoreductase [Paenibacillus tarimensis]MCF2943610.1 LLM class flavin-dependent oxidoreductase [Paenibacillus tarimensis]